MRNRPTAWRSRSTTVSPATSARRRRWTTASTRPEFRRRLASKKAGKEPPASNASGMGEVRGAAAPRFFYCRVQSPFQGGLSRVDGGAAQRGGGAVCGRERQHQALRDG